MLVATTLPTHAGYMTYGAGTQSCGAWIEARRKGEHYNMGQWMLGFLSAAGYYGEKMRESESSAMLVWMDNYCQQQPLKDFSDGVKALTNELSK
jgi:hypothetical protein